MNSIYQKVFPIGFFIGMLLLCWGCSSDFTKKLEAVPTAIGTPNQVTVIADSDLWGGPIGDSLQWYFSSAYPILPQPEPIFDLRHFTREEIESEPIRRGRRTYIIIGNLNDENSPTAQMMRSDLGVGNVDRAKREADFNTTVGHDKWARGQILIYLFGTDANSLVKNIQDNYPAIAKRINQSDRTIIDASVYMGGEDRRLIEEVTNTFGIHLKIPGDYFRAVNDGETMWLRKENEFLSSNIIIHKMPYTDKNQFTQEGIKNIRDKLGVKYISTEIDGTFMRTNDVDLPMLVETVDLNGNYAAEARGIWDIVNDFMGGPFLSYLILSPDQKELIFIDAFVHSPGKRKRKFMQHVEYIFSSFRFEQPK